MRAVVLHAPQFSRNLELLSAMYRMRRRVFKDRLDWSVSVSGEFELDVYDALGPTYLVLVSDTGQAIGAVRLLPATGPTMLADTFPALLGGETAPRGDNILESSRFCVDTGRAAEQGSKGLNRATMILFAAMIEAARLAGADSIVTVTDIRMERILRRAGWPLRRIAAPQQIGSTMAVAGFLETSEQSLLQIYGEAGIAGPVLVSADIAEIAA
ncbi:Acyl-homoserine-lactone synthase [Bradyrhizobium ivorense]|uniref:acyl-homoserine-lactone synthase n=1 Tax=Bradyrhizobium ivorense TaxID=2511166 RepID=A0A508TET4_9BRAD|nr:acyl-homoserine-lactone synthase [Bradyrhizobium ivorense]MCC8937085.1 conjugal transfer protein TraI [Bradyrhizobium ivorense]VIO72684.1 Acyl-homoserine-lactone synthase [Bradyrhizobium ivorense]